MTTVTVNLEDLERIVFATAVIKQIECALTARNNDPFVKPHLDYADAHDRLATAVRHAQRSNAGTLFDWDGELTETELTYLKSVIDGDWMSPRYRVEHREIDSLAAKGCIILGQLVSGVVWVGAKQPELGVDPKGFAVKVTDRGKEKLRMLNQQEKV